MITKAASTGKAKITTAGEINTAAALNMIVIAVIFRTIFGPQKHSQGRMSTAKDTKTAVVKAL